MGQCLDCLCQEKRLTQPSVPPKSAHSLVMQKRVLAFAYKILSGETLKNGSYLIGVHDSLAAWRCVNCGLFETSQDFCIRVNGFNTVQFQIPLCDKCRLYSVVQNHIYNSAQTSYRGFYQLSIICDLIKMYRTLVKTKQQQNMMPELMMVI